MEAHVGAMGGCILSMGSGGHLYKGNLCSVFRQKAHPVSAF